MEAEQTDRLEIKSRQHKEYLANKVFEVPNAEPEVGLQRGCLRRIVRSMTYGSMALYPVWCKLCVDGEHFIQTANYRWSAILCVTFIKTICLRVTYKTT